ncbi:MAG: cobalt transporter CbiM [Clostridia bacterium]|nr:cobalt transporter CbiM [Clostridia bacterium]
MHIPDGYLSLQTSIPFLGAMAPIWSIALNKVKKVLSLKQVPLLSLCAAFSFVVMMFNIPLGQSSVHAIGAVFIAVLLGPWAACIAVSIALVIQAFVFSDGGIIAIGANCFNIAFIMPFAGYYIYKAIAGKADILSKRSIVGIFIGSYAGINLAALFTAVEFGIQPILYKTAEGQPLYGFFPLAVSVPVMMFEHLVFAGPVEAAVTVSAVTYLAKFSPQLFAKNDNEVIDQSIGVFRRYKAFILALLVMVILTPVGLFATGTAWGEWGKDEIRKLLGFIPEGMDRLAEKWDALIPDYTIPGLDSSFFSSSIGYIVSAAIGIVMISVLLILSGRFIVKKGNKEKQD